MEDLLDIQLLADEINKAFDYEANVQGGDDELFVKTQYTLFIITLFPDKTHVDVFDNDDELLNSFKSNFNESQLASMLKGADDLYKSLTEGFEGYTFKLN